MAPEHFVKFEEQAMPHSWYLVASEFYEQANSLWQKRNMSHLVAMNSSGEIVQKLDSVNRCAFLIGGFALENIIKAFLVYENPSWISEGRLHRELISHNLIILASKSKKLPRPRCSNYVLEAFGAGLETWARYPCGLNFQKNPPIRHINSLLWSNFQKTFHKYELKLKKMMEKNWKGPYKQDGRFKFIG